MTPEIQTLLEQHFANRQLEVVDVTTFDRIPGLYDVDLDEGSDYVVVRDGQVVTSKGLPTAGEYMQSIGLLAHKPEAKELLKLLLAVDALPPVKGYAAPDQYYDLEKHAALVPAVRYDATGGQLVVNYLVPNRGGPRANPGVVTVMRWTLAIPPDYRLAWREDETQFDTDHP